jgi:hypothetical protein
MRSCRGLLELRRAAGLRVAAGFAFGAGEAAASCFFLADGAPFGCRLAAELDDGVVVEAVGVGEVAASAVNDKGKAFEREQEADDSGEPTDHRSERARP